ncbi:MAG TPA: HNH endonuclease signature motif containing protein [bacterium]|nr:MAG: HNH endonuclease [bacterium ADurb.Bin236]HOY61590.1 HNH endonuclease signature motif containing protein [bacterium]HPI76882.1 HNH endonuclease signature motif containing protein [bacterium]HPN93962.1 HNH endonuclease signature motif containing protein [bacterium]
MAKRRQHESVEDLIGLIDRKLAFFGNNRSQFSLRDKVLCLADIFEKVKDLGVSAIAESGINSKAARERIRLYLLEYPDTVIDGIELAVVSGIADYPRRIRELRVEHGYQIATGASQDPEFGVDLSPDQYFLVSVEPDLDAARRWHIVNRIRKSADGSRQKILAFLLENVGKVVTTEELYYVSNEAKEFGRRTRELRTENGYMIATRFTGRPDLKSGQYILQSDQRIAEPHDRQIPDSVQKEVYSRDSNKCRLCGWSIKRWSNNDPRILELHHIEHHKQGGPNTANNLIVLCSKCHDEVHSGKHKAILDRIVKQND